MSKIDELIAQHCPDGVEYKTLGNCVNIMRGKRVVREQLLTDGPFPVYQNCLQPLGYHTESNVAKHTTFIIAAGAAGDVGYSNVDFWAADDCYVLKCPDILNSRYLYHLLLNGQGRLKTKVRTASIPRLPRVAVEKFMVPVPPLPVQEEIVRILDKFTELEAELEAELEVRRAQYQFYRDKLLSFNELGDTPPAGWRMLKLSELCKILRGKRLTKSELSESSGYPVYHGGIQPLGFYHESNRESNTVMIVNTGASSGTVGYSVSPFWASDGCYCLSHSDKVISRYLYYALIVQQGRLRSQVRFAGVPTLDSKPILNLSVMVPPLEEQARIVSILDKFDALVNDLTQGLPAELEARRKQYAYYRDKLLSFQPMV